RLLTPAQLADVANGAAICRSGQRGVGLQSLRHVAFAVYGLPGLVATCFHGGAAVGEFLLTDGKMNAPIRNIDFNCVAVFHQTNVSAFGSFGRSMTDYEPRRPAGKAAVSQQRRTGSQTHRFEIRGGIQHLLHARAAFGAFVANDHNVPCLDFAAKNAFDGGVLALVDFCRTGEGQDAFVDTGGLDNTAIGRKIAVQHSQPAVLRIGVLARTNATALAIEVERVEIFILTERDLRRYTAGSRLIEIKDLFACMPAVDVPLIDGLTQRTCMHIANVQIEQPGPGQLAQDAEDAACAV